MRYDTSSRLVLRFDSLARLQHEIKLVCMSEMAQSTLVTIVEVNRLVRGLTEFGSVIISIIFVQRPKVDPVKEYRVTE